MSGRYELVHHLRVPNMLHGRVVLPRGQRAFGAGAKPLAVDEGSIKHIPSARVVRKGDFVGVVADNEWDAVKAAQALKVTWQEGPELPGNANLFTQMRAQKSTDTVIANRGDIAKGFAGAAHVRSSAYFCPYQGHLPFGPNCALADVRPDGALIRSSTQDVYNARAMLARVLGMPADKVRVQYYEGSGTFGRSCYEDAAQAAAIMSQAVGRPVRVQYMRWDEHGWDNYGPAHLAEVRAGVNADGKLIAYEYHGWQHGWTVTSTIQDIALQKPGVERTSGSASITVNPMSTGSMYVVPNRRVISHAVPMEGYLRGAALRSPLDLSFAFASEQTIDELAYALKMDPFEFRRRNIGDKRWLGVLEAAAKAAGLEAAGDGVVVVERRGRARPRHRARHPSRVLWRGGGRHRGQPAHRRDRRHASLRRARLRACRQSGGGRDPDHRPDDPVGEPRAQGRGAVRQARRHEPRLGSRTRSCASPSIPP